MKVGVIGLGSRMAGMLKVLGEFEPDLTVVGVVDPDESGVRSRLATLGREAPRFFEGLAPLVEATRPDALCIGTRCNLHTPYAVEAAPLGLPIYLEKPVATSMQQARALEQAFGSHATPVVVSFPLRVSLLARRVKEILESGVLGSVEHVLATNYVPYGSVYFERWYRDYTVTQGLFLQKATHDFDALMHLTGSSIVRVAAMQVLGRVHRDSRLRADGPDDGSVLYFDNIGTPTEGMNEDSSSALLQLSSGAQAVYTQVFYSRRSAARRGMVFSGARATLEFDWYAGSLKLIHHYEPFVDSTRLDGEESHFGGDRVLARNFADVVAGAAPSASPIEAGLQSVYACLAAKESAENGRYVDVRQVDAADGTG